MENTKKNTLLGYGRNISKSFEKHKWENERKLDSWTEKESKNHPCGIWKSQETILNFLGIIFGCWVVSPETRCPHRDSCMRVTENKLSIIKFSCFYLVEFLVELENANWEARAAPQERNLWSKKLKCLSHSIVEGSPKEVKRSLSVIS